VRPQPPLCIQTPVTILKPAEKSGTQFLNPVPTAIGGLSTVLKVLPEYLRNKAETEPKHPLGPFATDPAVYAVPPATGLRITWFGHSSSLVELDGFRILIDPVWDPRASPFTFLGPKRFFAPTLALADLPTLDAVLLSHDHYDHLGAQTVRNLAGLYPKLRWVTSLCVGKILRQFGVAAENITELDWTQSFDLAGHTGGLRITAWPARHFSGRSIGNRFETLWSSFVLEGPHHRVYFGADSGYDLTMLEIGAYHPLWASIHLGPDNAARAFADMGPNAGFFMPIHWGLFNLALHAWKQPIERMWELANEHALPLWSPTPGAPTDVVPGTGLVSDWWQRES
jgi:L-ascorbate metabolism protein UlaG (beta-lactamase superfamily)